MIEKIGNVTLDLTYYPGEDLYCDGTVEDELLSIVKQYEPTEYRRVIEEKKSWPILYHLSPLRENIVSWLPLRENAKILEVGAGCGAITGALARNAASVTCIDLSKKRSSINAYRHKNLENVTIKVGNFQDIEPSLECDYDYIFLIGVFEYAQAYIHTEQPYETFLNIIKKHLKSDGKIAIAIENKYGLKYFAGCREDHLGEYFSGIESYPDGGVVRTFSRTGMEDILSKCGVTEYSFYYPYPDYKFMSAIYSDERLPRVGELTSNLRNFDRSRLLLFDEKKAFDGMIHERQFSNFSNSYFVLIGSKEEVIYSKFSNDRAQNYAIRTDMVQTKEGKLSVLKRPANNEAKGHIQRIINAKESLKKRYDGSDLVICDCKMFQENLVFPYLQGETLEEKLDQCLEQGDMESIQILLQKYANYLSYHKEYPVADFDLIFPNILIHEGIWQVIDYEWTYNQCIEPEKIAKRALYCYIIGNEKRGILNQELIYNSLGIKSFSLEDMREEELNFQQKVTGDLKSLSQMRDLIGEEVLPLNDAVAIYQNEKQKEQMQLYIDTGKGFIEAHSCFVVPTILEETDELPERFCVEMNLTKQTKQIRLDPARFPCLVTIHQICTGSVKQREEISVKNRKNSGIVIGENTYLFKDEDPNITIPLKLSADATISIEYSVVRIPDKVANTIITEKTNHFFGR